MDDSLNWLAARLQEPSTWRGLMWLATACGVVLSPEAWQYIATAGMALAGLVGVLTSDKTQTVNIQLPPIELVGKSAADRADTDRRAPAQRVQPPVDVPTRGERATDISVERPSTGSFPDSFGDK
jgi:hypothetical protein